MSFFKRFISDFRPYFSRDIFAIAILGFSSGLPIMLTLSTLTFWLSKYDVDVKSIGLMSLLGLPYVLKFVWAPFLDYAKLPLIARFGRRKSWILLFQVILIVIFIMLSMVNPIDHLFIVCILIFSLAFFSASQDIVIDAFRIDILTKEKQAYGSSAVLATYRIAVLFMGAGVMILSDHIDWSLIFIIVALLMTTAFLITLFIHEPNESSLSKDRDQSLIHNIVMPFVSFFKHKKIILILGFIICFKLPDSVSGVMMQNFYIETGYSGTQIGTITKIYGTIATFFGIFLVGNIVRMLGTYRALLISSILAGLTNLLYIAIIYWPTIESLVFAITFENLVNGFSGAILVTFLSALCNKEYSATQYAFLSSVSALGLRTVGAGSGYMVSSLGWNSFFIATSLLFIPALLFLVTIKKEVDAL